MATIKMVYTGKTEDGTGARFIVVTDEDIAARSLGTGDNSCAYDAKAMKKAPAYLRPGCIVTVEEGEESGSIRIGTMQNAGLWPDDARRARWQEDERSREAVASAKKEAKDDDALRESLAVARSIYSNAIGARRAQVLARIISILHS